MYNSRCVSSRLICALTAAVLIVQSVSCGSILYPERIGQSHGPLDPKVVALDTAGLLLFVVPGAIAFAVDFYNGTIYMPTQEYRGQSPDAIATDQWIAQQLEPHIDTREKLQQHLRQETGEKIDLADQQIRVIPLDAAPTTAIVRSPDNSDQVADSKLDWERLFELSRTNKKTGP